MYLPFYGLREEPFQLTPDPRFLHLAEPHRETLIALIQTVLRRRGFAVIIGPVGTGKTTLLHTALQLLNDRFFPENRLRSALIVNPLLTRDEFLEAILDEFEVPCASTSKPARLSALHQAFLQTHCAKGTTLLMIDEAHLLSPELLGEIRLLSNADTHREKLLQIVLCGQPELAPLLAQPEARALQQRISRRNELRPLSLPETRAYVVERLHAAGLKNSSPFAGPALEEIFRYTAGVPRLINQVCDAALIEGFHTHRKQIQPDIIQQVALALELAPAPEEPATPRMPATHNLADNGSKSAADLLIEAIREGRANVRMGQ